MKHAVAGAALLAVLASIWAAAAGPGEGVVVIRSSDLAPYKALEESFVAAVGVQVTSLGLSDLSAAKATAKGGAVVLAIGQDAARIVQEASPSGTVFYGLVTAPEKLGLTQQARVVPMFVGPERQLSALRAVLPNCRRLGVIYGPSSAALVESYQRAAATMGATVVGQEVKDRSQVANALRALLGEKIDALLLLPDPLTLGVDTVKFLLTTSLESKVPLVGFSQGQARAGALLSVEVDYQEMGREAGVAARRALNGGASMPQAPTGSMYINGKTAQVLGVALSSSVKAQSKEVF